MSPGRSPCRGKGVSDMPCLLTKEKEVNAHPLPRTLVAAWPPVLESEITAAHNDSQSSAPMKGLLPNCSCFLSDN